MTQCRSTFPLVKGGCVFCVKRRGHDGDHRGVGKQWRDLPPREGFISEVGSVKITEPLSSRAAPEITDFELCVLASVGRGGDPYRDRHPRSVSQALLRLKRKGLVEPAIPYGYCATDAGRAVFKRAGVL